MARASSPSRRGQYPGVTLAGVRMDAITEPQCISHILDELDAGRGGMLVTPNLDEAAILTGRAVHDEASMARAGETLLSFGAGAALVKGGHLAGAEITDLLVTREGTRAFRRRRLETTSTHGTECTLSAAVTASLALGRDLETAVADTLNYVHRAIAAAPGLGGGYGPLNHTVPPLSSR